MKTYNNAVHIQLYLGSGPEAEELRRRIDFLATTEGSRNAVLLSRAKKADPGLFKGLKYDYEPKEHKESNGNK